MLEIEVKCPECGERRVLKGESTKKMPFCPKCFMPMLPKSATVK